MATVLVVGRPDGPDAFDLLPLLQTLVRRRHRVVLLATEEQRRTAEASAVEFRLLPSMPQSLDDRAALPLIGHVRRLFRHLFIDSLLAHWPVVRQTLAQDRPDIVLADALCFAACMLAELPSQDRPPVVVLGTIPPPHANPESAPYGLGMLPSEALVNRLRNRLLRQAMRHVILGPVLPELRTVFRRLTGQEMGQDTYDAAATAEVWAQCEPERFEYPLHVAPNLELVGPLSPAGQAPTDWWRTDDERETIVVRASDPSSLQDVVVPAILALEGRSGVRVVVTGVDRSSVTAALGHDLPQGVEVAGALTAARLPTGTRAVVERGWFVHALHALQQGAPVIAVGTGAEEVETAARLRWHGCGVGIRSDAPTPEQIRAAVDQVLDGPLHLRAAARIAAQCAGMHAEEAIGDLVERLLQPGGAAPPPVAPQSGSASV